MYKTGDDKIWKFSPCPNCGARQCFVYSGDNKRYATDTTCAYAVPHECNIGNQLL